MGLVDAVTHLTVAWQYVNHFLDTQITAEKITTVHRLRA